MRIYLRGGKWDGVTIAISPEERTFFYREVAYKATDEQITDGFFIYDFDEVETRKHQAQLQPFKT
jgi:hypothetical protein